MKKMLFRYNFSNLKLVKTPMNVTDTSRGANEAWMSRQALQDVYQKLLVMDLEYALDKKVEQELYVHNCLLAILSDFEK